MIKSMKINDTKKQYSLTEKYLSSKSKDGIVVEIREGKKSIVLIVDNGKSVSPRYAAFKTLKI